MKVVVIAGSSWSLVHFRLRLLLSIRKAGHSISAISIDGESQEQIASILSVHGIEHISLGASRSGVNILKEIYHFLSLYRIVLTLKPDLVFAYTAKAVIYGGLVSRVCKIGSFFPMITGLGYAFTSVVGFKRIFIRHLVRLLYKLGLSRARTTIFQNTDDLELFHQLNIISKKSYSRLVNGSGVDLDAFPLKQLPGKPVFLMLSRLVADKGVREYVEAARIIKQERPNAVFRLAGGLDVNPTSINDEELNRWIEDDVIEYFGKVDTVQWLLEQCRFYVLPSYREGVPRSVLEAMATGRPVITTDTPGCRETVIDGVNGYLVQPGDVKSLAGAMIKMLEAPDEAIQHMAKKSLSIAREKYDVHKVNQQMLETMGL